MAEKQVQAEKTARERMEENLQGLKQMMDNREQRRKQLEDRINEIDRELSTLANSREASELVGDSGAADKAKKKADELKKERGDLADKLALFRPETSNELFQKFKETPGQHKTYAQEVDRSGLEVLNDLQDRLDSKQQELQALAAEYRQKVEELRQLSNEAGNVSQDVIHARKFLRREEQIGVDQHRFRVNHVLSDWQIAGHELKDLVPGQHV